MKEPVVIEETYYEVHYTLAGWKGWAHFSTKKTLEEAQKFAHQAVNTNFGNRLKGIRIMIVHTKKETIEETTF